MIEFAVVGPIITLLGMAILQYCLMFFAKNQINHAAFMAARGGAMANASIAGVKKAYVSALVPLYGGGTDATELAEAYAKADLDVSGNVRIEILNPTKESYTDWNDEELQNTIGNGRRVIPNVGLSLKNPEDIKSQSGQSIQDANLLKLRITHGYEPKVPMMKNIFTKYLQWSDTGGDTFYTQMVDKGRIPVVTHVTLQMQSNAIEPDDAVSTPGMGDEGNPSNPGDPPVVTTPPPDCATAGCNGEILPPVDPGSGTYPTCPGPG